MNKDYISFNYTLQANKQNNNINTPSVTIRFVLKNELLEMMLCPDKQQVNMLKKLEDICNFISPASWELCKFSESC